MLINVIQGYSASMREERECIGYLVNRVVDFFYTEDDIKVNVENSNKKKCIRNSLDFISQSKDQLILVGKSFGAIKTWEMIRENQKEILDHKNITCLLVDPHGYSFGDGVVGWYGKRQPLSIEGIHPYIKFVNIYQYNRYPHGAKVIGRKNIRQVKLGEKADHFNIADIGSDESLPVVKELMKIIRQAMK